MLMGLDAQLIAIGPFSRGLLPAFEYSESFYADVPAGAIVITSMFVALTSGGSHLLVQCFGVGALELHRHALGGASNTDVTALVSSEEFAEAVPAFLALRAAGFQFYYLPNA